jgi:hypothetical protein
MKRVLLAGLNLAMAFSVVSCGSGGGSSSNPTGGGSSDGGGSGGGDGGGGTGSTCSVPNPVDVNGTCYAYCSADKSFCVKDDEMPSQLVPNKAVKKCYSNSILIDDQCQQITLSIQGDKNSITGNIYGNITNTSLVSSVVNYDPVANHWVNSKIKLNYLKEIYTGSEYEYYWQSNIPNYVFPNLNTISGYEMDYISIGNGRIVGTYDQFDNITPMIKFGAATYDVSKYSYSSFVDWCHSLNNEWVKFDEPLDPATPPQFTIQIQDDKNGGNYITCSAPTDYYKNIYFKNSAPYIGTFRVKFDCNYLDNNDCRLVQLRT